MGGAGRSFMIADSARRALKPALYGNARWLLLHATQAEQLRKGQQKARATMAKISSEGLKTAQCASPVAQVTHVYS
jgi:hypothetical protein